MYTKYSGLFFNRCDINPVIPLSWAPTQARGAEQMMLPADAHVKQTRMLFFKTFKSNCLSNEECRKQQIIWTSMNHDLLSSMLKGSSFPGNSQLPKGQWGQIYTHRTNTDTSPTLHPSSSIAVTPEKTNSNHQLPQQLLLRVKGNSTCTLQTE